MGKRKMYEVGNYAFLRGARAAVFMSDTSDMVGDSTTVSEAVTVTADGGGEKEVKFVYRGRNNRLPVEILEKVHGNVTVGSNVDFNAKMAYGDGIMVMRKRRDERGKVVLEEVLPSEAPEIFGFLADNNYVNTVQEWANDLSVFGDTYAELIFSRDEKSDRVVRLLPVESANSRVSEADEKTGRMEYHGYSTKWHEGTVSGCDVAVTRLVDRQTPLVDLKEKRGMIPGRDGRRTKLKDCRYMLQLMLPTPARCYYGKPYWWTIFTSKWYDFACAIPEFKTALLKNQMVLKYHVRINQMFWDKLFKSEGISDPKRQKERRTAFLNQLDAFLSGEKNAGKSFVSHFEYDRVKGFEEQDVVIAPIESFFKGGEYIEDSEEATNIICYAMGVHPSIIGASPGKGKSINGTEARELFIIKQALMKPIRDLLVLPLYIVKELNGWDKDIYFFVPNIMLTTLDRGTGAEKSIGNQKI